MRHVLCVIELAPAKQICPSHIKLFLFRIQTVTIIVNILTLFATSNILYKWKESNTNDNYTYNTTETCQAAEIILGQIDFRLLTGACTVLKRSKVRATAPRQYSCISRTLERQEINKSRAEIKWRQQVFNGKINKTTGYSNCLIHCHCWLASLLLTQYSALCLAVAAIWMLSAPLNVFSLVTFNRL